MNAWLLLGWLALYPSERISIATYATQADCEQRVAWLDESGRKRSVRREYACVELPAATCADPRASLGVRRPGGGGMQSLHLSGSLQRAGVTPNTGHFAAKSAGRA